MKKKIALFSLVLVALTVMSACGGPPQDGKYAKLAQCLTQKGVIFFGAFWCPHCQEQKAIFGEDMRYIDYVECDVRDPSAQPARCEEKKIDRYPTWFFPGQGSETGLHQPEDLAKKVGCEATLGTQQSTPVSAAAAVPAAAVAPVSATATNQTSATQLTKQ